VSSPQLPSPWWLRPLEIWDGDTPRNGRERAVYLLALAVVFGPIPAGFTFAGWVVGQEWFALGGFLLGALVVRILLTGVAGNSVETAFVVLLLCLFLLLLVPAAYRLRDAIERRRQGEADRLAPASVQSPPATDRRRSPHRTSPLAAPVATS
jgi:hypothetical protein